MADRNTKIAAAALGATGLVSLIIAAKKAQAVPKPELPPGRPPQPGPGWVWDDDLGWQPPEGPLEITFPTFANFDELTDWLVEMGTYYTQGLITDALYTEVNQWYQQEKARLILESEPPPGPGPELPPSPLPQDMWPFQTLYATNLIMRYPEWSAFGVTVVWGLNQAVVIQPGFQMAGLKIDLNIGNRLGTSAAIPGGRQGSQVLDLQGGPIAPGVYNYTLSAAAYLMDSAGQFAGTIDKTVFVGGTIEYR